MDLALNNQQKLICHKAKTTDQPIPILTSRFYSTKKDKENLPYVSTPTVWLITPDCSLQTT